MRLYSQRYKSSRRRNMSENLKHLNDDDFENEVSKGLTLVDFYADWCGPCRRIAPLLEELSCEMQGQATIAKLDIEHAQKTTERFGVTSIPTLILFKDGKEVKRLVGLTDKESLRKLITASS